MNAPDPCYLELSDGRRIGYQQIAGSAPGVVFCGGFRSDMSGTKAAALAAWCQRQGRGYLRFDYTGHGCSSGRFEDGSIGQWLDDTLLVLDRLTQGPQVLVGSSMGGWISLLTTLARPERIAGLLTIACATDFTRRLIGPSLSPEQQQAMREHGITYQPSEYDDGPYPITARLLDEGEAHCLLDGQIPIHCPVRMLHGLADRDVPWQISLETLQHLASNDATLSLVKDGDHRLSKPDELQRCFELLSTLS